ncbi:MAG TPA: hypothetical protein VLG09_05890 [Candidatus Saccharimonadales bacterium]|nr:hypothetical protein [Candidatus Saccharimonadales bacterium]
MTYNYYDVLMRNKDISELTKQKKITIDELSGGGCEINNHVEAGQPHIKSIVLDLSVEDPLFVKPEDGHEYEIDLENAFGLSYGNKDFERNVERLAEFIAQVYKNNVKAIKKGILGTTHIQTKDDSYRARLVN